MNPLSLSIKLSPNDNMYCRNLRVLSLICCYNLIYGSVIFLCDRIQGILFLTTWDETLADGMLCSSLKSKSTYPVAI